MLTKEHEQYFRDLSADNLFAALVERLEEEVCLEESEMKVILDEIVKRLKRDEASQIIN